MSRHLVALAFVVSAFGCHKDTEGSTPSAAGATASGTASAASVAPAPAKAPLRVAYSDWPGWTAFEVGIQKGWFKEAGLNVEFSWFDYLPSLDAFSSGKVDAVM